jgi:TonB family protein
MIGLDGKVRDALVQESDRPDLNAEALQVVQQWIFTPATCNGRPSVNEASFTVHFQGR